MKTFYAYESVFGTQIVLCFEGSLKEALDHAEAFFEDGRRYYDELPEVQPNDRGVMYHLEDKFCLVWLREKPVQASTVGVLVHELGHCVHKMLGRLGMDLSPESDEAYCYLQQFYITEFLKQM